MNQQVDLFGNVIANNNKVVNVASVPQRSLFRYPGGKTWFVPAFRKWIRQFNNTEIQFIEPFVGGGIISLTAAFESLAKDIICSELDDEIAAVWNTVLSKESKWLSNRIINFDMTTENVNIELAKKTNSIKEKAFITILKNRVFHGGIITKGSGLIKKGENGKGISSRWYPSTLKKRIEAIDLVKDKIKFIHGDAFKVIEEFKSNKNAVFFIDPPYIKAGRRLYTHFDIDHKELFRSMSKIKGRFLMTYDNTEEVRKWADEFSFNYETIPMKTTHHSKKNELVITN